MYEFIKSRQAFRDIRNKSNGRRVVARDMYIRAILFVVVFILILFISALSHFFLAAGVALATQDMIRMSIIRPLWVLSGFLLIAKLISSTYARIRLERMDHNE